jgi:hypothetical protein
MHIYSNNDEIQIRNNGKIINYDNVKEFKFNSSFFLEEVIIKNSTFNKFQSNPTIVNYIAIYNCLLEDFENSPFILGDGEFNKNKIKSLYGIQSEMTGSLYVDDNQLSNLKYAPKYIKHNFSLTNNKLNSLEGMPHYCDKIDCSDNLSRKP